MADSGTGGARALAGRRRRGGGGKARVGLPEADPRRRAGRTGERPGWPAAPPGRSPPPRRLCAAREAEREQRRAGSARHGAVPAVLHPAHRAGAPLGCRLRLAAAAADGRGIHG